MGALLALWAMERAGLRTSLLWGYGSQLACAVLAYAACVVGWPPRMAFALLYLSQARRRTACSALSQCAGRAHAVAPRLLTRAHRPRRWWARWGSR